VILRCTLTLFAWLLFFNSASSQNYPQTQLTAQVDELFAQWDQEHAPGATIGIYQDGKIVYAQGYGTANLDHNIPLTPGSVLRIGSISKQFMAMCIAILAERQQLSLDDDIRIYLPEMPDYGKPVTIRHLLHHTNGIREYLALVSLAGKPEGSVFGYTAKELVEMLSRQKALNFEPGSRFSYTNSGYFLLAEIVTRVSGIKASAFALQNIFEPLGMTNTQFYDDRYAIIPNRAFGYSPKSGGGYSLDILRSDVIGDLGVITTVEDFLKWDQNFYQNRLGVGTDDLINTMFKRGRTNDGEELDYALGVTFGSYRGLNTIGHGGSAVGYNAEFLQFPDQHFSVVILSNVSSFRPGVMAQKVANLYLADQFTEPIPSNDLEETPSETPDTQQQSILDLGDFVGDFYSDELDVGYSLSLEGNNLYLDLRGTISELVPHSEDRLNWGRRQLIFSRDQNDDVSGFELNVGEIQGLEFLKLR